MGWDGMGELPMVVLVVVRLLLLLLVVVVVVVWGMNGVHIHT